MKLISLLWGIILFAVGTGIMFSAAGTIFEKNNVNDDQVAPFISMAENFAIFGDEQTAEDSTIRAVGDAAEQGAATEEEETIFIVDGSIKGGRIIFDSIANFGEINSIVQDTVNSSSPGQSYIDPNLFRLATAFILILITVISIQFIRGFKLET